jgi:site-specific recombinase XerD
MTPDYRPNLVRSFERRRLRAENRSEHTTASYLESLRRAPETVATRYRRLRVLYRWLEEEEEIAASPMAKMRPPIAPEQPVPVVPEDALRSPAGCTPHALRPVECFWGSRVRGSSQAARKGGTA